MKWRIASIAFLLGTLSTAVVWLSLQPVLVALLGAVRRLAPPDGPERLLLARLRGLLPLGLGLALVGITLLCFLLLHLTVGRPLRETEALVAHLGQPGGLLAAPSGGPLLRRVHTALSRTAQALGEERERTRQQLEALREANARLAHAQMELVSAERLAQVGRLAAGVAHEVGNPLSGILGYLSLVRTQVRGTPAALEHLAAIEAEVARIDGIVRSLLDVGRPATGRPACVPVLRQAEATVRLVAAGREFSHVEVGLDVPPELVALCEPGALSQVLINLLLNAASAMGGRGQVRVVARGEGSHVLLAVEDHGPGIPEAVFPHLFEPFFTTKKAEEGTGLGLAIARHLAQQQGGELRAENRPGGGARFTLVLPAAGGA